MTKTLSPLALLVVTVLLAGCSSTGVHSEKSSVATRSKVAPQEAHMKAALQQYLEGFKQGNAEMLYSLFADHAKIEDPVGGGRIVEGKEAITTFYQGAVKVVERLELDTPIRGSYGNAAAMAFTIYLKTDEKESVIQAIDVMTFDDTGKIVDMKAFHGPSNKDDSR